MLMEGTGESRGANMLTEIKRKVKKKRGANEERFQDGRGLKSTCDQVEGKKGGR